MKPSTLFYKIFLTLTILFGLAIFACLFNDSIAMLIVIPFFTCLFIMCLITTIYAKLDIISKNKKATQKHNTTYNYSNTNQLNIKATKIMNEPSKEEKLDLILKDKEYLKEYIFARLAPIEHKDSQSFLAAVDISDQVFIKYDNNGLRYIVVNQHGNILGLLTESTVKKFQNNQSEIENLKCYVFNKKFDNNNYICDIVIILNKTNNITKNNLWETHEKCTTLNDIIRVDYTGEAIPQNAKIVTLKNKHKFSSEDFLSVYGYQTYKTAKSEYFYFLDKSRTNIDETGNKIYPTIKVSAKTIFHFPDLTSEEAKKYIAISYAERASKNYVVPAEEINDITHYRNGQFLYERQNKILKTDYCVIDIETTGLNRHKDQIIEISALRVRNNEITDTFTKLVKPTIPIPYSATKINGITDEMVINAPTIKEVISQFLVFVSDDIVIGHNICDFDLEFINNACIKELNKTFDNDFLDTYILAKNTFTNMPNYRLASLCHELGITQSKHRAESDCISTKELFDQIKLHSKLY